MFSFWVPILFSVMLLLPAGKAHGLDFAILYAGNSVVDLSVGDCGSGWRCELYRNSELTGAWENRTTAETWYSDTVSPGVHRYFVKRYYWNSNNSQWVEQSTSTEQEIDSRVHSGAIRNSSAWAAKLGRDTLVWAEGTTHYVGTLSVEDGNFFLNDLTVVFDYDPQNTSQCGSLTIRGDVVFQGDGSTFSKAEGATCNRANIALFNQSNPSLAAFQGSAFNDITITASNCANLRIIGNTFNRSYLGTSGTTASGFTIDDNQGNAYSISISTSGGGHTVRRNLSCASIYVTGGNNVVEKNQTAKITANGNADMVSGNRADEIWLYGQNNEAYGNQVKGFYLYATKANQIHDNVVDATGYVPTNFDSAIEIASGEENVIERNRIIAGMYQGIKVYWGQGNFIQKNTIVGSGQYGIKLASTTGNRILNNVIREVASSYSTAIFLYNANGSNSLYGSKDNVIAFNHIWGNKYGIQFSSNSGNNSNGFHENIIENNTGRGVSIVAANNNNSFYNNVLRGNDKNAVDYGTGNTWNVEKPEVNRNIVGGPWLGGNYWSDYTGTDVDGDGIGDTVHTIKAASATPAVEDHYPLKPAAYNPAIGSSRTAIAFESTATGATSAPQELLVSSAGNMDLVIWQAAVTGTDASLFAITTDTCSHQTLPPGATCAISVTFTPDAQGEKNAVLSIPSSAAGEPEKQIPLRGGMTLAGGDVNGDGAFTLADAVAALQVLAGLQPGGIYPSAALSNGKIGLSEALHALQKAAELR
jgi:parallel beta-helix repeat protein